MAPQAWLKCLLDVAVKMMAMVQKPPSNAAASPLLREIDGDIVTESLPAIPLWVHDMQAGPGSLL